MLEKFSNSPISIANCFEFVNLWILCALNFAREKAKLNIFYILTKSPFLQQYYKRKYHDKEIRSCSINNFFNKSEPVREMITYSSLKSKERGKVFSHSLPKIFPKTVVCHFKKMVISLVIDYLVMVFGNKTESL